MNKLHPHSVWLLFFGQIKLFIFAVILFTFAIGWLFSEGILGQDSVAGTFDKMTLPIGIIVFFVVIGSGYIWSYLFYKSYGYELTEDTYKSERGVVKKRYISIPYEKIQNVDIERGLFARILGLSDIKIHTAGYGASGTTSAGSEGWLPGLDKTVAEQVRNELVQKLQATKK